MMYTGIALLTELLYIGLSSHSSETTEDEDLIIGGLFPVHEQGVDGEPCGRLNEGRGIHRVGAMLFAIKAINDDPDILPNIRLGARIFDSCSNPSHALNLSLTFVRDLMGSEGTNYQCSDGSDAKLVEESQPVAGVIGGSYSGVSIQTAHLLRLFNIVQISPASTNADLSDKSKFDLFARTVPSDIFQARVLADIARLYNWTYVSLVYSAGEYGELGAEAFKRQAKFLNVCIALEEKISKIQDLLMIAEKLKSAASYEPVGPRVVVLFTRSDDTRQLLRQVKLVAPQGLIKWLAADGWEIRSTTTRGWENIADGALVITLDAKPAIEFEEYFLSLRPHTESAKKNPWFNEFWRDKFNCSLKAHDKLKQCSNQLQLTSENFQSDDKVQFVIDAVYALALALHRMFKVECRGHTTICNKMKPINGTKLYQTYLMNVNFTNMVGNLVHFDKHGDGPAYYKIMSYRSKRGLRKSDDYVEIGTWRSGLLNMHDNNETEPEPFVSRCSLDCPVGFRKELVKGDTCCWGCVPCYEYQFNSDDVTCTSCVEGQWPTEDRLGCRLLPIDHIEWTSPFSIVPCILASIGLIMLFGITISFIYFRQTPLIKAAGTDLCYILIAGAAICYIMVYFLVAKPSKLNCGLRRVGVGLGFAVIYASLLVKTNRIYRIFHSVENAGYRPKFISSLSQLVITGALVSVQLLGSLIWLAVQPPEIRIEYPTRNTAVLQCNTEDLWFLLSLAYDALLIVICTVYAVKTRTVPENFNEAKFIGFTMYTTCVIWLAFVPLYFGTEVNFRIQITTLSICISLSATVSIVCLFAPKLWIVFMEPERNVRRQSGAWLTCAMQASYALNNSSAANTPLLGKRDSTDKSHRTPTPPCSSTMYSKDDIPNHSPSPLTRNDRSIKRKKDIFEPL